MRNGTFGFSLISWRYRRRRRCHCLKSLLTSINKLDTNIDFSCVEYRDPVSCLFLCPRFTDFPNYQTVALRPARYFGAGTRIIRRSMAETLPKLTPSRAGYRAQLTKTLNKAKDLMKKEAPTEMDVVSLNSIIEQLTRKKSILTGLDEKIAALIEEPKDLEQEIFDDEILDITCQIGRFIHVTLSPKKSAAQPPSPTHQESPQMVYNETTLVPGNMSKPSSSASQENVPSTSQAAPGETVNDRFTEFSTSPQHTVTTSDFSVKC